MIDDGERPMIKLKPGDIFCSTTVGAGADWKSRMLAAAIRKREEIGSMDGQAFYTHAGIVMHENGRTYEARWTYDFFHMDDYYQGPVLIGRPRIESQGDLGRGLNAVIKYHGRGYPFWRLAMFLVPGMTKISLTKLPVCSELVCMFAIAAGIEEVGQWKGQNPDHVADMIKKWDAFDVIYEGNWPGVPAN
jgi:hypothetical protein